MTKIFMKTSGCSLNQADSEIMKGLLEKSGFEIVSNENESDLFIVNTCTVKGPTANAFFRYLSELKETNKPIVVAGCIAQTTPELIEGCSLIGTKQINNIVQVVEETLNGNLVSLLAPEEKPKLNLTRIRKNKVIEIIPVASGCLGNCTYCIVKKARGKIFSYSPEDIIRHAKEAIKSGAKELWLTSQDNGAYGKDLGTTNICKIVKEIAKIPGEFMIRIGMANPNHTKEILDEFIEVLKLKKVFKFVHLPVQSGDNDVLKRMNRRYTSEEFGEIIKKIKSEIPDVSIATDIIVGFPGETEENFKNTIKLVKEIKPDVLNLSRFWPRPGTEAEVMDNQIPGGIIKDRSRFLTQIFDQISFERNKKWKTWQGEVLIDEQRRSGNFICRNNSYKMIIVEGKYKLGDRILVKIIKNEIDYLIGKDLRN